jgi:hypothetical protein
VHPDEIRIRNKKNKGRIDFFIGTGLIIDQEIKNKKRNNINQEMLRCQRRNGEVKNRL